MEIITHNVKKFYRIFGQDKEEKGINKKKIERKKKNFNISGREKESDFQIKIAILTKGAIFL